MQNTPILNLHNDLSSVNSTSNKSQSKSSQHVSQLTYASTNVDAGRSFLLELPDESLGYIITYLDTPTSLIVLSQVNRRLRDYVANDSTWFRSFAYHYWGIGQEEYLSRQQELTLRRSESTWKKEFIKRHELLLQWEKSRSAIMSYQPHSLSLSGMHLLDNLSLMTTNLQYGVVARSFPLTGKILRGFFDASGTANGFGIGNPNVEFSPHVSCIEVSSRGGTAHIAWGFRSGEIALTTAPRVIDSDRPAARYVRCRVQDEHPSQVQSLIFCKDDELVISGCLRGQVKLWETKRLRCLWSGTTDKESNGPADPVTKLVFLAAAGHLAAACQSGDIVVWTGFQLFKDSNEYREQVGTVEMTRIIGPESRVSKTVDCLFIDPESDSSKAILIVHYFNDTVFFRYTISTACMSVVSLRFGTAGSFPITFLKPCFTFKKPSAPSSHSMTLSTLEPPPPAVSIYSASYDVTIGRPIPFILTGDSMGRVTIWRWDVQGGISQPDDIMPSDPFNQPCRTWDAHDDGSITTLEATDHVIVTGSSNGTIKVWDMLTLNLLRSFPSPTAKSLSNDEYAPVGRIFVRDTLLVASIGNRVLVWQAKPIPSDKNKVKRSSKFKGRGVSATPNKWQQQMEIMSDIKETKKDIEAERAHAKIANDRVRAEQTSLHGLGLTEAEAVDYLLMLSREEVEERMKADSITSSATSTPDVTSTFQNFASDNVDPFDAIFTLDGLDPPLSQIPDPVLLSSATPHSRSRASSEDDLPEVGGPSNVPIQPLRLVGSWSKGSPTKSWESHKSFGTIGSSPSGNSSSGQIPNLSGPSRYEEDDDVLRFVLELSLAEARSRDET